MNRKTKKMKILGAPILFIILLLSQSATIGYQQWTVNFLIQAIILNLFILIGIYAFRGFEYDKSTSMNSCFVTFFTGTIAGTLIAIIPILLFFDQRLHQNLFIITLLTSCILNPIIFCLTMKTMIKSLPIKKYLVIGKQSEIEPIFKEIEEKSMGKIKAYMYMNPSAIALEREISQERIIDGLVIADPSLIPAVEGQIEQARVNGIEIDYLPNLVEAYLQRIPLEIIDKFKNHYEIAFKNPDNSQAKRIFDIFIASFGLIITAPISFLLAIAIPIESGFPILFKQKRIGYKMQPFKFIKFRSLKEVEKKYLDEHENPNDTIKLRNTAIGKIIRKLRIDEIPQFINVLKGTMSVIGPRPEMENYHNKCIKQIPFYHCRYNLKPGITGWAQINFKHTSGMDDYKIKTEYDLYYIKNRNILLDLEITMKTIETMIGMRGSK